MRCTVPTELHPQPHKPESLSVTTIPANLPIHLYLNSSFMATNKLSWVSVSWQPMITSRHIPVSIFVMDFFLLHNHVSRVPCKSRISGGSAWIRGCPITPARNCKVCTNRLSKHVWIYTGMHMHTHTSLKNDINKNTARKTRSLISLDLFQHGHHKQLLYWPFINM